MAYKNNGGAMAGAKAGAKAAGAIRGAMAGAMAGMNYDSMSFKNGFIDKMMKMKKTLTKK